MKKLLLLLLSLSCIYAQTAIAPSAGDGSEANPYHISSLENLYWIAEHIINWDKHYIQTCDINAASCKDWEYSGNYCGWKPIGNSNVAFTGTYDGHYFKIDSLSIVNTGYSDLINQGLFGFVRNAEISNIGLTNTFILIPYGEKIGSLTGYCDSSTITNCYCVGAVNGSEYVGGLLGYLSNSTVNECYVKDDDENSSTRPGAKANDGVAGGISGYSINSIINNCYSDMYVLGGTSGSSPITTWNNYFEEADTSVNINKCYSKQPSLSFSYNGLPESDNFCGWPVPYNDAHPLRFIESLKQKTQMKNPQTYLESGWDFVNETENGTDDIWNIDTSGVINDGYPYLSWEYDVSSNFTYIEEITQPMSFKLNQNYPNPFNPRTAISYQLVTGGDVDLLIYDVSGHMIYQWSYQSQSTGIYEITWNGKDLNGDQVPSGVYIYRVMAGNFVESKKMVLLK